MTKGQEIKFLSGTVAGYSIKGLLSTVAFYNRALTAEEISNLE